MKKTDCADNTAAPNSVGAVYIHIPFCRKKCNYCDFVSIPIQTDGTKYHSEFRFYRAEESQNPADKYLKTLAEEFSSHFPLPACLPVGTAARCPLSIYVGGGTPSVLSEKQIIFLFGKIVAHLTKSASEKTEITFEVNPESVTKGKLKILKKFGVNRLSFGLQSFDDKLLEFLGRVHTKKDFLRAFAAARKTGFNNINIDLIFGIPGQTLKNWESTLKRALSLNPEHISVYNLTVEEGTNFYKEKVSVDDDLSADMYGFAIGYLKENGYNHYEISNFSKPGFECIHNLNYWKNGEYLGLGLGAVSYLEGVRIKNTENLADYLDEKFRAGSEKLDDGKKISEDLMLGLRITEGVRASGYIKEKFGSQINNLKNGGLLTEENDFLKLTDKGIMFANCVFREFL